MSLAVFRNADLGGNIDIRPFSRLYCAYGNNIIKGLGVVNQWQRFPKPSSAYINYRNQDFTIDPDITRFTYTGATPKWFNITVTCNVAKASDAINQSRTMEFQWRLNGEPIGVPRVFQMNTDTTIISGNGQVVLQNGHYIEPWWVNSENGDEALLTNCTFNIVEDPDQYFDFN